MNKNDDGWQRFEARNHSFEEKILLNFSFKIFQNLRFMKRNLFSVFLFAALFLTSGCDKDSIDFSLQKFTVNDQYVEDSGRFADDAVLRFEIKYACDELDNDYFLDNFQFGYRVNGSREYLLQSDSGMGVQSFGINAVVDLLNIELPAELENVLIVGDKILFFVRATDSCGMSIERQFEVVIE